MRGQVYRGGCSALLLPRLDNLDALLTRNAVALGSVQPRGHLLQVRAAASRPGPSADAAQAHIPTVNLRSNWDWGPPVVRPSLQLPP